MCMWAHVCVWGGVYFTPFPPVNNLERRRNKREGKVKWRVGVGGWGVGGDVICHLQLMKAMMTCMSTAYVRHLLRYSAAAPLREAVCGRVPRRVLKSRRWRPGDARRV